MSLRAIETGGTECLLKIAPETFASAEHIQSLHGTRILRLIWFDSLLQRQP
jgi:hypothetical protein